MTCYHPIKAFIIWPENSLEPKFLFESVDKEYTIYHHKKITDYMLLPCGKCIGCQMDRSRDWANRMVLELESHECASFITLTYSDEYLPYSDIADENGEFHPTLRKKDFQDFMKRLRKQIAPVKIRFFSCGEYGEKHKRPHYHAIIFGFDFPDKVPHEIKEGYITYRSPLLERVWSDPVTHETKGFCLVADVNWNTCAYVSRYCTKKIAPGHNIYYQTLGIEPEFNTMSRRPGIGRQWYEENKEELYIKSDSDDVKVPKIILANNKGGLVSSPPKYFDRLFQSEHPDEMQEIKERRRLIATRELENKLRGSNMTQDEMLRNEERKFLERIAILKREKV